MQAYLSIFSAQYRMLLQYRAAAWAGFGTQLFWGLIRVSVFAAFYSASQQSQPINYPNMVSYLWLVQALFALTFWSFDPRVAQMIKEGSVGYELLRPIDLYWHWFCRAAATRIAPTTLRSIPLFVVAGLCFGLQMPPSPACFLAFLVALFGTTLLVAAFSVLLTITLIRTIAGEGIARFAPALTYFLSGMAVPIPLMPDGLQKVVNMLPFRHILDAPIRLYLGHIPIHESGYVFLHEAVWIGILVIMGRAYLKSTTKHLVVQGG
jgi:ABC-2 type transport system permease protein